MIPWILEMEHCTSTWRHLDLWESLEKWRIFHFHATCGISAQETVVTAISFCDVTQTHIYLILWGELMLFNSKDILNSCSSRTIKYSLRNSWITRSCHCLNALSMRMFFEEQKLLGFFCCVNAEKILALLSAAQRGRSVLLTAMASPCLWWLEEWLWLFSYLVFFSRWCSELQVVVAYGKLQCKLEQSSKANEFCCPAVSFPPSIPWWSVSRVLLVNSSC